MQPKIKITGSAALMKKLKRFGIEAEQLISETTQATAEEIAADARGNLNAHEQRSYAKSYSIIADGIEVEPKQTGALTYVVGVQDVPMAAYLEFGTGAFIDIPPEWQDIASAFYVNGQGTIRPQPFLYTAFNDGRIQYEKDLNKMLEHLTKRYSS